MKTTTDLPVPSSRHATCAWCREHFDTITELIDHVDAGHTGHIGAVTVQQAA